MAIGYDGDALVSSATGLAWETIHRGHREIAPRNADGPHSIAGRWTSRHDSFILRRGSPLLLYARPNTNRVDRVIARDA